MQPVVTKLLEQEYGFSGRYFSVVVCSRKFWKPESYGSFVCLFFEVCYILIQTSILKALLTNIMVASF